MKEIVVISGKGGTGKTSVLSCFAGLAEKALLADCDVDASNLHLMMGPVVKKRTIFKSGHEAEIVQEKCIGCGACLAFCRFEAIQVKGSMGDGCTFHIDPAACEGCGVCVKSCPVRAISFEECVCGEWFISETDFGPMVHARLGIAAENSGKLVTQVRQAARKIAEEQGKNVVLVDGPPGIGCPVVASVTNADEVLVVTEPTLSGKHDLERVIELVRHFDLPAWLCVNKWDINPEMTKELEERASRNGLRVAGRVPWDSQVTAAQRAATPLNRFAPDAPSTRAIEAVWKTMESAL